MSVNLNYQNILKFVKEQDLLAIVKDVENARNILVNKLGAGNEFVGWVDHPHNYDREEFSRIIKAAEKIRNNSEVLVVIGIGGSYLGAKAIISALSKYFDNQGLEIVFVGHTLSSTYTAQLLKYLEDKSFAINVISKSGTTTEPAIAFRLLKNLLFKKYGNEAKERIFATTDKSHGALRVLAEMEGYETFIVPDNIGGRYSWFTAVGLLPIACCGLDIELLMNGAYESYLNCVSKEYHENDCLKYAAIRYLLEKKNYLIEILVAYEPKLSYLSEWWKQLFGESEGKDGKGIFPASVIYSTDLHSMGQYIQEGKRILFETVLNIEIPEEDIILKSEEQDLDGLNYLDGKGLNSVNQKAMEGTILAHVDGQVPNLVLTIKQLNEFEIGYLLYFFMFSCGIYCYLQQVNPFNQPGVESYKRNMFALLGKPGFEDLRLQLEKRLK